LWDSLAESFRDIASTDHHTDVSLLRRLVPEFRGNVVPVGHMQQALEFAHEVLFVIIQPTVRIHHLPHLFDQASAFLNRPMLVNQSCKSV
jgi:hypothetical protein